MNKTVIRQALESFLGKARVKNDELQFHCPFCQHQKRKFNINLISHAWHCWVCGSKGRSLFSLAKKLQAGTKVLSLFRTLRGNKISKTKSEILSLPPEFTSIYKGESNHPDYRNAVRYLKKRGISGTDVLRYNIGYATSGSYSGMIIIPSYNSDGHLNYFTSRAFYEGGMTHKNPPSSRDVIGYELFVNWHEPLNIVEGPFDAVTLGGNTVPLFGKTLSKSLIKGIIENNVKRINLILDKDALVKSLEHAQRFISQGIETHIIDLPGKDPNELGKDIIKQLIKNSKPVTFGKLMEYKLYAK